MTTSYSNDYDNVNQSIKDALREALRERGHINIFIAGRTGVGKSTLINAIFQGNIATTGQGRPVTTHTREFRKEDLPISIFDTRGLEMADFSKTLNDLHQFVNERSREIDPNKHIHVAWICIAEDLRRVEPAEEELVKILSEYMPVIAVITKSRADNGFRSKVQELLPLVRNVISVRAIKEELDEGYVLQPKGLKELVELTLEVVPEGLRRAFTASQKVDIELKKKQSHLIVLGAASSAAAIAASPIPFSDAVGLVPIQLSMLAGISATFGLSFSESLMGSIIGVVVSSAGGAFARKAIIAGLLKFIPGAGSIAGGLISGATSAALTTAFGEAYIATLATLFVKNNGEPPKPEDVIGTFKAQYLLTSSKK